MAYSRVLAPTTTLVADELTSAMVGIGMGFAARASSHEPNIAHFARLERPDRYHVNAEIGGRERSAVALGLLLGGFLLATRRPL